MKTETVMTYADIRKWLATPQGPAPYGQAPVAPEAFRLPASLGSINRLRENHGRPLWSPEDYAAWHKSYMGRAMASDAAFMSALTGLDIRCKELEAIDGHEPAGGSEGSQDG